MNTYLCDGQLNILRLNQIRVFENMRQHGPGIFDYRSKIIYEKNLQLLPKFNITNRLLKQINYHKGDQNNRKT